MEDGFSYCSHGAKPCPCAGTTTGFPAQSKAQGNKDGEANMESILLEPF